MVRHNNVIPNGHFHKNWQIRVKTWFNQPARKTRRNLKRKQKQYRLMPRPIELLRPIVHCPTIRYNGKVRSARGFTHCELKAAGLHKRFASTIGIVVDHRRRNKSVENMLINVQRLKEYYSKLIIYPRNVKGKPPVNETAAVTVTKGINKIKQPAMKCKSKVPSEEEKKFNAYFHLQKAKADEKFFGRRIKRREMETAEQAVPKKKVRICKDD